MSTAALMPERQSEVVSEMVTVRMCVTDRAALKAAAERSGTTCSYLIRLALKAILDEGGKAVA